ncbi:MAG: chemotaxis protein CheW [Alphaproteobacteria bacterium]|nr:chemotaxis protein CheW [Alphaproteobacteria bacterium]
MPVPTPSDEFVQGASTILVFEIAGSRLALNAAKVDRVCPAVAVAPLPQAPAVVEGIVDVAGTILPVFDLRRRFGWAAKPLDPSEHFVLAQAGSRRVLIRADRALAVSSAEVERPEAAQECLDGLAGIARLPDGLVLIHDLAAFLSGAESEQLDVAMGAR